VRIGDYRLFYSFGDGWVKLLSVRKRDERTFVDRVPGFEAPDGPPPDLPDLEPDEAEAGEGAAEIEPEPPEAAVVPPPAPPATTATDTPLPFALTEDILKQWQIPADYWPALKAAGNEDDLFLADLPVALFDRICDNLFPRSIDEIEAQPEYVLPRPEDLDRFVEGELQSFLLKLDAGQQKILDFGLSGPTLVKGGPGTGKSVLALHRAHKLVDASQTPVLFTTYTNALVRYSEQLLEHLLGCSPQEAGITVNTVDALAFHYYAGAHGRPGFATDGQLHDALNHALDTTEVPAANAFDRRVRTEALRRLGNDYLIDEFCDVIEAQDIGSAADYLAADRRGRSVPLRANMREALWAIYESWAAQLAAGGVLTWEQLRRQACRQVEQLDQKPYRAIIIDEAQDLAPVTLRFLLGLVESPQGIYLTADASQSLYQRGFSWKQIHSDLNVRGRTMLLRRNYRNTAEISAACATIMAGSNAGDSECVEQEASPFRGAPPTIHLHSQADEAAASIRDFFSAAARQFRLPLHAGAVLCHSQHIARQIVSQLKRLDIPAEFMSRREVDITRACVKVLTLHSAKGLEFPFVAIVYLEEGQLPYDISHLPEEERQTILDQQRRLFYVGCSRAMRALLVCGSQPAPSSFLHGLDAPQWQRIEST
jgi:superfamily I DNA/RNA helicase